MVLRRVFFRLLWVAAFVLPVWVLVGRAFFGVPLGLQFLGQIVLVPLLFIGQVLVTALILARRSVRQNRAVSWLDASLLTLSWLAQLALGFFIVDSSAQTPSASAFTAIAGAGSLDLSTALFALAVTVTIASGIALIASAAWQWVQEARRRVVASLADLEAVANQGRQPYGQTGGQAPGFGDPGPVIRIAPRE
ncbi:hypothetical protein ACPEEZ_09770 [Frigoribacterium sp. 2-23]|uniref:hypothetical protein n=1 Tax=Frigoribacterium sp. 2-23 TaxID=3415006 RepID=UPI003C6F054F